ncbi:MAG: hypothetical protein HY906_04435 [Deltaproteobacteria bacterium]|nr:hypothetical protein [Deltaproteobacteria bacterium]
MKVATTLWRLARLGFFVGWGVASVAVAACGGRPSGPVEHHDAATEAGARDAGSEAAARDGGTDAGPVDANGWDVPLE